MEILTSPSTNSATSMLDALTLQQQLLARNIANANVENYRPSYLDFDSYLREASRDKQSSHINVQSGSDEHLIITHGNVQLDMELLRMQETVLHYKTLLDVLSRKGALMKTVINGAK